MSEIVFILGAGASKHTGAPLMNDFLSKADGLRNSPHISDFIQDFNKVFDAISKLQIAHSKSSLDLDNIESVFAVFEMAKLINKFPEMSTDEIESLIISIKRLILRTLDLTVNYNMINGQVVRNTIYDAFAKLIEDLSLKLNKSCTIITFNYDIALDYALESIKPPANYCISDIKDNNKYTPYIKLHGSLNWFKCSVCEELVPWKIIDITQSVAYIVENDKSHYKIPIGNYLPPPNLTHCEQKVLPEPFIVPPTWNKSISHKNISKVWGRAAKELENAEQIIVSGYSLPESDYFFRYLFALGTIGQKRIKRIWVFDPDIVNVAPRFINLLSKDTEKKIEFEPIEFAYSIQNIRNKFDIG